MLNKEIELGVISLTDDKHHDDLEILSLVDEQVVVCMAAGHEWQNRKSINIKQLNASPMVIYEKDYFIRKTLDQLCQQHAVVPDIRIQTNFLPLIIRTVKQGLGTTIGLSMIAREEDGIIGVPLSPRTDIKMAIAKRRDRVISRANQTFMDWLGQQ